MIRIVTRAVVPVIVAILAGTPFVTAVGAFAGGTPNPDPTTQVAPPTESAGPHYALAPVLHRSSPLIAAAGTATSPTQITKPHLALPGAASSTSPAQTSRVETITSVSRGASSTRAAQAVTPGISPLFGSLITHDAQVSFNGLNAAPPDTQLAVGPSAWLETVNDMGRIVARDGGMGPGGDFDLRTFFQLPSNIALSDPKVVYDAARGRWYMSGLAFDSQFNSLVVLAVSQSSEPTLGWLLYLVLDHRTDRVLCDQPHLGFSDDKVTVACDDFNSAGAFLHAVWIAIDKGSLVGGATAKEQIVPYGDGDTGHSSLQPVYSMTSTNTQYVTYLARGAAAGVIAITGNPASGNVSWSDTQSSLVIPAVTQAPPAPQQSGPGVTSPLTVDTGDVRFMSAVYGGGIIWTAGGDRCLPAGDTSGVQKACLRLVQVTTDSWPARGFPRLTQNYDVSMIVVGSGDYLYYPALAMDAGGTTYVTYNESSAADSISVLASDILPALPGAIDQTFSVGSSGGPYVGPASTPPHGSRFGDYSSAAPDPRDGHTIFVAGEISAFEAMHQDDWGGAGGVFSVPACSQVSLSAMTSQPFYPGPMVNWTAGASGCWGTPEYRFWELRPGGAWTIVQDYSASGTFSWDTSKEGVLGTYRFEVDARFHGAIDSYQATSNVPFVLGSAPCTNTVGLSPMSPAATGGSIIISNTNTCPDPIYRFWIKPPGGAWTVVQDYGKPSTYTWNTTGLAGSYGLEVDIKERLDAPSFYGLHTNLAYVLIPCTGVGFVTSPASPHAPGGSVAITATAACPGTPLYRFWVRAPNGNWSIAQDYGAGNTYTWPTTGLAPGSYALEVDVKDTNATASYEAVTNATYLLTSDPCVPSLSASPNTPGATGASVTFTSSATGCTNPRFRFWVQKPGGPWSIAQDYSAATTFVWSATGLAGTYNIEVDSRDQSETVPYDGVASMSYRLNPCSSAGIAANPPSPRMPGAAVTLTGASSCPGTPSYRFWMKGPGGSWSVVQAYGSANTFNWSTAGLVTGTYSWEVDVRNQGATDSYEAVASLNYLIGAPCDTPTIQVVSGQPGVTGARTQFSATTSTCPTPQFRWWIKPPGGSWTIFQDYPGTNTMIWNPQAAGTYGVEVDVRDQSESVSYDAVSNITFDVGGCTSVQLQANPAGSDGHGAKVYLTATANCTPGSSPQYRFWIKPPGSLWTVVQDYPQMLGNTFVWDTQSIQAFGPGTYYIEVDVRNNGVAASYEAYSQIAYELT